MLDKQARLDVPDQRKGTPGRLTRGNRTEDSPERGSRTKTGIEKDRALFSWLNCGLLHSPLRHALLDEVFRIVVVA